MLYDRASICNEMFLFGYEKFAAASTSKIITAKLEYLKGS